MARLFGQRWRYQVGNSIVVVDNAYSLPFWGKERLLVNDEEVQSAFAYGTFRRTFSEPWLTSAGEDRLKIVLTSGLLEIRCGAWLGGTKLTPLDMQKARWTGDKRSWPDDAAWRSTTKAP